MNNLDLDKIKKINNGQSKTVHYCNNPLPVGNIPVESSCVCSKPSLPQIEPTPNIVENCVRIPHNCSKPLPIVNLTAIELAAITGVLENIIKLLQGLKADTDLLSKFTESITKELTKTALEETLITSTDNILEKILDIRYPEDTLDLLAKEETVQSSTKRIIEKIGEVSLPEEILNQLAKEETLINLHNILSAALQLASQMLNEGFDNIDSKIDNLEFPEIDTTQIAKEQTLIDLSTSVTAAKTSILNDINLVKLLISDIKLPEIDTSNLAQESTLQWVALTAYDTMNTGFNSVNSTLNNILGPNTEATNSAILALLELVETSNDELIALQLQNIIG